MRKHGSLCLDKPVLLRNRCHGTHITDISQPYPFVTTKGVQQASIHPRTQEHMELQLDQHFDTHMLGGPTSCPPVALFLNLPLHP